MFRTMMLLLCNAVKLSKSFLFLPFFFGSRGKAHLLERERSARRGLQRGVARADVGDEGHFAALLELREFS